MTLDEIKQLMEKMAELGITKFEYKNEFEIQLSPRESIKKLPKEIEAPKIFPSDKTVPEKKSDELIKPMSVLEDLSPEEVLYYATPYYDEIQAQKEAHANQLAQEKI